MKKVSECSGSGNAAPAAVPPHPHFPLHPPPPHTHSHLPAHPILFWARDSVLAWDPSHGRLDPPESGCPSLMSPWEQGWGGGYCCGHGALSPSRKQQGFCTTPLCRGTEAFSTRSAGNARTPGAAWGLECVWFSNINSQFSDTN